MQAFHNEAHGHVLPEGHRFPMAKYRLLREALGQGLADGGLAGLRLAPSLPATPQELVLAHHPAYVAAVHEGSLSPAMQREIGFPWTPGMAERARRSVGGTLQASRAALAEGLAGSLGGGTHHASSDRGGGFCVFNDIAVAARLMQAEQAAAGRPPLRVLVIDLDVHQGNGTASIFGGDDSVFTFSMHGARNFPFRKVASDLDVELPDDCEDAAYLAALDQALAQLDLGHQAAPFGLIYYQAGVDVHVADRLGRLSLSDAGVAERDARVFDWALRRRLPLVLTMGGGYAEPITTTVRLQRQTWGLALQAWQRWQDELHTAARGLVDIGG
ncbi:MAG: hypothetical protein RL722_1746 [Pseudomonadota bacterium]|jgi:acetoin utilization deacetylase AcuC-like enzyme